MNSLAGTTRRVTQLSGISVFLAGSAVYASGFSAVPNSGSLARWTRCVFAGILLLISSIKLVAFISGSKLPVDALTLPPASEGTNPAVMSPAAACSFFLFGGAFLLPRRSTTMP